MTIVGRLLLAVSLSIAPILPIAAAEHGAHWTYEGKTGPSAWGKMDPTFAACGVGKTQSPIDIHDAEAQVADLPPITFDYKPVAAKVIDNGHTIQVNLDPGNTITFDGKAYTLVQFHFHKPSEEKIDGKAFDMVAHLVHKDADGKLAVVAVLLRAGSASAPIARIWAGLPSEKGKESALPGGPFDVSALLPRERGYFAFQGSLTTPPCSEGVQWLVLRSPVDVSSDQVAAFGKIYPKNARPTQTTNGRAIRKSKQG